MKTSLLLLYICEWLQKEGMVAVPQLRQQTKKTMKEICAITGVSQAALYRKLRELKKDEKTNL